MTGADCRVASPFVRVTGVSVGACRMRRRLGRAPLIRFDAAGIAMRAGSACSSVSLKTSHVLEALGVERACEVSRVCLGHRTAGPRTRRHRAVAQALPLPGGCHPEFVPGSILPHPRCLRAERNHAVFFLSNARVREEKWILSRRPAQAKQVQDDEFAVCDGCDDCRGGTSLALKAGTTRGMGRSVEAMLGRRASGPKIECFSAGLRELVT